MKRNVLRQPEIPSAWQLFVPLLTAVTLLAIIPAFSGMLLLTGFGVQLNWKLAAGLLFAGIGLAAHRLKEDK